jgi:hypothetical protein
MPHTQNMRAEYGLEKKEINMDKPGVQYVKWNKLDTKRKILHGLTYMWNLKTKKKDQNTKNKVMVVKRKEIGRCKLKYTK